MRDIRNSEKQSEQKKAVETVESDVQIGMAAAAVRIQKLWRGFITRKFAQRKREEELIFIGMVSSRKVTSTSCIICGIEGKCGKCSFLHDSTIDV